MDRNKTPNGKKRTHKNSPGEYRKDWCCTSCGKRLPDSKKGWGLIWDTSDAGMCQRCLYWIRKQAGYFEKDKSLRTYAPKTRTPAHQRWAQPTKRSYFVKEDFESMYNTVKSLYAQSDEKPLAQLQLKIKRLPRRFSLHREGSDVISSLSLRKDDYGYLVETSCNGIIEDQAFSKNQKEEAVFALLQPHIMWEVSNSVKNTP